MGNGSSGLIPAQTWRGFSVPSTQRSFYTTLPHKLDAAEEEWIKTQPVEEIKEKWDTQETGTFGEDGWSISTSYKAMEKDD